MKHFSENGTHSETALFEHRSAMMWGSNAERFGASHACPSTASTKHPTTPRPTKRCVALAEKPCAESARRSGCGRWRAGASNCHGGAWPKQAAVAMRGKAVRAGGWRYNFAPNSVMPASPTAPAKRQKNVGLDDAPGLALPKGRLGEEASACGPCRRNRH